jgi:protein SDA1
MEKLFYQDCTYPSLLFPEVTKLLQFIAQASHELVPPELLESILKTLADKFITERNSADVMAIG